MLIEFGSNFFHPSIYACTSIIYSNIGSVPVWSWSYTDIYLGPSAVILDVRIRKLNNSYLLLQEAEDHWARSHGSGSNAEDGVSTITSAVLACRWWWKRRDWYSHFAWIGLRWLVNFPAFITFIILCILSEFCDIELSAVSTKSIAMKMKTNLLVEVL